MQSDLTFFISLLFHLAFLILIFDFALIMKNDLVLWIVCNRSKSLYPLSKM